MCTMLEYKTKKIMVTDISFENFKNIKNLNLLYFKLEVTLNQHFP